MTDKQINVKLPDELWLAAKIKAAENRTICQRRCLLLREWVKQGDGEFVKPR